MQQIKEDHEEWSHGIYLKYTSYRTSFIMLEMYNARENVLVEKVKNTKINVKERSPEMHKGQ